MKLCTTPMRNPTIETMLSAPSGAVYVWRNENLVIPRRHALSIGRDDLQIVPRSWIYYGCAPCVVLDPSISLCSYERGKVKYTGFGESSVII